MHEPMLMPNCGIEITASTMSSYLRVSNLPLEVHIFKLSIKDMKYEKIM